MTRLRGHARRGERVIAATSNRHWNTTTFLAGLRHNRIVAPLVLDGAINGQAFRAYVEQFPAPTLEPDNVVIADNLGSCKVAGVREAIEARGACMIFLPADSPDLNPNDQVFAKLNQMLRSAAPRTRPRLRKTIGKSRNRFTQNKCTSYLVNAGYRQSA